ncbi:MAG: threonine/serine dehydratase [Myxococcota bacterium]|jgi:threo-3-hydroxy-L-aspartate ammonia-lyase|nr:threonine/serine dehydratase [Myxococcota bacterium]
MLAELTLERVRQASERIRPYIVRTPVLSVARGEGCTLVLKPESLQPTGAFKLRGAINKLSLLGSDCPGVVAHSSGNHAQAVAWAAKLFGLSAAIVMPRNASTLKRQRAEASGAEIIPEEPDSDVLAARARGLAAERGWALVEPYDDVEIAAGQGTSGLELFEDAGPLDRFYAPISGGGLMAGCAVVLAALNPEAEIVGCEPEDGGDTRASLAAGTRCGISPPRSIADGLRVRRPGEKTWPVVKKWVRRVELVSDDEMLDAMAWALHSLRLVLEPSGAASLALALREAQGRSGVLLSGGNVDPRHLAEATRRASRLAKP